MAGNNMSERSLTTDERVELTVKLLEEYQKKIDLTESNEFITLESESFYHGTSAGVMVDDKAFANRVLLLNEFSARIGRVWIST